MKFLPHFEALCCIRDLEKKVYQKSKKIKELLGVQHCHARDMYCKHLGFKNHYHYKQIVQSLKSRAELFLTCPERLRCAFEERLDESSRYYIFQAYLGLGEVSEGDDILSVDRIRTLESHWVGWGDLERSVELRVASLVDPRESIRRLRLHYKGSVYTINTKLDLGLWVIAWGGVALIRESLVREDDYLARWLKPYENIQGWS